jgi:nicotinamidase-related amidase
MGIREYFFRRTKGSIALILVDMQTKFVKKLREGEASRIIPNQLAVIEHCNRANIPIIVLELRKREFGKTIRTLTSAAKKNPRFLLIEKEYDSGFNETALYSYLKSLDIKRLFIIGINTDYCVKATASDAIKLGYEILTSNQVISGQSGHREDNSIRWFKSK